ncbi:cell division protein ZapA [Pseudogemmobacter sp. W21_MBD1_M6]|jgi:cell division protein ZapA|uniref:cell division protein ZapA n=1 Tax=Pseudogemmobacter sp. W21_MBD1_M6 TaxID=3240271 RepID=UPI003F9BA15A
MADVDIHIGGRTFSVACQDGEEHFLHSAAKLLDVEADVLLKQVGRIPEARMLLMSGLMLADKTAGLEEQLRQFEAKLTAQAQLIEELRNRPAPAPERIEVAVIPDVVTDTMAEIAARAEALAEAMEDRLKAG